MIATRTRPIIYVAVLASVLLLSCTSRPEEVSLARLAHEQEAFSGDEIKTHGTVRKFENANGTYFVLEDESRNRVALLPASMVERLVGQEITVTGRFELKRGLGRVITVDGVRR